MGMSEDRLKDIVLQTLQTWEQALRRDLRTDLAGISRVSHDEDERLSSRISALATRLRLVEYEVATRNGPGGLGHIGEEIVDAIDGHNLRRAQLAERRLEEAIREVDGLRTRVTNLVNIELKAEKASRDLETMTDYATKLKTERDMARGDLTREKNHHAVTSRNLQDAADAYVNAAEERDMADAAIADVRALADRLESHDNVIDWSATEWGQGYRAGIRHAIRSIRRIV